MGCVGIEDESHFTRDLKIYGISPASIGNRHRAASVPRHCAFSLAHLYSLVRFQPWRMRTRGKNHFAPKRWRGRPILRTPITLIFTKPDAVRKCESSISTALPAA